MGIGLASCASSRPFFLCCKLSSGKPNCDEFCLRGIVLFACEGSVGSCVQLQTGACNVKRVLNSFDLPPHTITHTITRSSLASLACNGFLVVSLACYDTGWMQELLEVFSATGREMRKICQSRPLEHVFAKIRLSLSLSTSTYTSTYTYTYTYTYTIIYIYIYIYI